MRVRPAQDRDMDAVAELEQKCFTDAWSEALISNMFSNSFDKIYVLEDEGGIRGYANIRDMDGDVDLMAICVDPECRGRGYAALLLKSALPEKYNQIILEVRESNAVAIHLYERFGFEKFARRRGYYSNPDEDAIIMIRK